MGEARRINDNDIDKDVFFRKLSMTMIRGDSRTKLCSDKEAESGAERYARLLNAPECQKFFYKVMYYLPYEVRERLLEASTKPTVKVPKRYFTYSAKRELAKRGF